MGSARIMRASVPHSAELLKDRRRDPTLCARDARATRPQPAGQERAFALPSICASLLPGGRNRLDRLLENFASFSSAAATPFRNCSSKPESHPANFPRTPRRKQSCRPSALPIRDRSNRRSQEFLPLLRTPFVPGLANLRPVQLRLWVSSKHHRPFFEKTARPGEPAEPPARRSVFGTLTDQRLFWIAAFFNLTADYADDTDLIPKRILIVGQSRRLPLFWIGNRRS